MWRQPLSDCKTAQEAIDVALKSSSRKEALGYLCLWECNRLELLPIQGDSCFSSLLEMYLDKLCDDRLIAAAPDLLAVCQAVYREMCRWPDQEGPLKRRLHEAIEKAKG